MDNRRWEKQCGVRSAEKAKNNADFPLFLDGESGDAHRAKRLTTIEKFRMASVDV